MIPILHANGVLAISEGINGEMFVLVVLRMITAR
jgi:hypothetical protein